MLSRCMRNSLFVQQPNLRCTLFANATIHNEIEDKHAGSSKIRKKYSELPQGRVLPDGTVAAPLGDWKTGEDAKPTTTRRRAKKVILDTLPSHDDAPTKTKCAHRGRGEKEEDREPVERKTRVRKVMVSPADDGNESLPKRKRKAAKPKEAEREVLDELEAPKKTLGKEIQENLAKFPHCLLLTRVGQFYESYFDQAIEVARLLNIKLTTRKWDSQRIHMCGFPIAHLDKYLRVLVEQNKRFVAMCEEFPRYEKAGQRTFERRVSRVITPGTLIDESFLNQYENSYLLAIGTPDAEETCRKSPVGLAWIDVTTGEFYTKATTLDSLRDDVARIGPREVVLHRMLQRDHPIFEALNEEKNFISYVLPEGPGHPESQNYMDDTTDGPPQQDEITDVYVQPPVYTAGEAASIDILTSFLKAHLIEHMPPLLQPDRENVHHRMQIDSHTIKALEIRESIREGGATGSLLSTVKRTVTTGGTRLLARRLCSPSTSLSEIDYRLSLVAFFHARPWFREDLVEALPRLEDAAKIVQKFSLGRGDTSDLLAIKTTTVAWACLRRRIEEERVMEMREQPNFKTDDWSSLDILLSRFANLDALISRIQSSLQLETDSTCAVQAEKEEETLDDEPEPVANYKSWRYQPSRWNIRPEFSNHLKELHQRLARLLRDKETLQDKLQSTYDAPSLTLRSSPGVGMHVHIAKAKRDRRQLDADARFVTIQTSNTTVCYFNADWARLGAEIFDTSMALSVAEKEAFELLRNEVNRHATLLRRNARIIDELDVTLAFANLAAEMNFVRPVLIDNIDFEVVNARHPTVELGLMTSGRMFTPNSLQMQDISRLQIITGPNMAGKSTLLRQTALISLLAQAGSFVPADYARLGIVDKLFSRVGAKDDLFHDRSTFMVEMLETADILRRATPQSLVIMDEVGRGTTIKDGLSLAYATVYHLATHNRCRALFATHFTELADMLGYSEGVGQLDQPFDTVSFFRTDVDETENGRFAYSYRIRPGVSKDSHGLKVALLAGMPPHVLSVAEQALQVLRSKGESKLTAKDFHGIEPASPNI